jgi:excisionase family DNA binding protein
MVSRAEDRLLSLKELSEYSTLAESTLRDHMKRGMPHFKVGGKILVRRSEFDQWIEKYRVKDLDEVVEMAMKSLYA